MKVRFIPIKAVTAGERVGSLQCTNSFLRMRVMEHLRELNGVHDVKRIAWDIIYFETDEGIKARDVLEAVHMVMPVFAAEMDFRRPWLIRNFWLLWAAAFGICHFTDMADAFISGDIWQIPRSWLAGLLIIAISFVNHCHFRWRHERDMVHIRQECVSRVKEYLKRRPKNNADKR